MKKIIALLALVIATVFGGGVATSQPPPVYQTRIVIVITAVPNDSFTARQTAQAQNNGWTAICVAPLNGAQNATTWEVTLFRYN